MRQQGFSLLEILIAFAILSLSIGIVLRIFSGGVKTAGAAEEYTAAVQIAESLLAKTGSEIPLRSHRSSGVADEKYNWEIDIAPHTLNSAPFKTPNAELFKINVIVDWGEADGDRRTFELATLKTLTKTNALQ